MNLYRVQEAVRNLNPYHRLADRMASRRCSNPDLLNVIQAKIAKKLKNHKVNRRYSVRFQTANFAIGGARWATYCEK